MSRRKDTSRFVAIISIAAMYFASPTAAVYCVWCDPVMSKNFVNCMYTGLLNSEVFISVPDFGFDDMRNSMIAAASAIRRSSDTMKMKMMNGAMAGELAELIKSQSAYQDNNVVTSEIMQIIGSCFVRFTGQSQVSFIRELADTVNFMLREPGERSEENLGNLSPFSPSLNPVQIPSRSEGFNKANNQHSGYKQNNLPQQQAISTSFASSNSLVPSPENNPTSFISSSQRTVLPPPNVRAIPQIPLVSPPVTSQFDSIATGGNAANFPNNLPNSGLNLLNNQPNSAGVIPSYNFNNDYDYASDYDINPVGQPNLKDFLGKNLQYPLQSNSASNSAIQRKISNTANSQTTNLYLPQDILNQKTNANYDVSNTDQMNNQNTAKYNTANSNGNTFSIGQVYDNHQLNNNYESLAVASPELPSRTSRTQDKFNSLNNSNLRDSHKNELPRILSGNNNQPGTYSDANASSGSYEITTDAQDNSPPSNNLIIPKSHRSDSSRVLSENVNQPVDYSDANASSGSSVSTTDAQVKFYPSKNFSFPNSQNYNSPNKLTNRKKLADSQTKRTKTFDAKTATKKNDNSNQRNNLSDDAIAKAMRFSETIFVLLSSSDIFTNIFNSSISYKDAVFFSNNSVLNALYECGYAQHSMEIANACSTLIKNIPEKSPSDKYAEAFSKSLMSQFYTKQLISDTPEDQARYISSAILTKLYLVATQLSPNSSVEGRTSSSDKASNKSENLNKGSNLSESKSSSTERQRSQMARRFYKTLCKRLHGSRYFRYTFNRKTPKAKAKSLAKSMLINSFKSDYGNKLSREAANECARRLLDVPARSKTPVYVNVIAECLTDVLFYYDLILIDDPASQAKYIASNINKWLSQSLSDKDQSTTVTPQTADFYTHQYNNYGQDYHQSTKITDYTDQQTPDKSSSGKLPSTVDANELSTSDSSYDNDNINYPYDYSDQQSDTKSGTDNDYLSLYDNENSYQKLDQRNFNNYYRNGQPTQNQKKDISSKMQNNGRGRSRNSNAQNTFAYDDTSADNTQSSSGYQPTDSSSISSSNNTKNFPWSKQVPPKPAKSRNSSPKDRIHFLMKVIPLYISDGKFNYKQFSEVLGNLLRNMLQSYKSSKPENNRIRLLIECLIASLQLLTKAQSGNSNLQNFKNIDISNFPISSWTSDSPEQENQDGVSKNETESSQPQETYSSVGKFKNQNTVQPQSTDSVDVQRNLFQNTVQRNTDSQTQVFQNDLNSFQANQQNSYTSESSPNAQNLIFTQRQTDGIQPQAAQNNWNSFLPIHGNRNPIKSQEFFTPNSQAFDRGLQYRQDNINSAPQRSQNIYSLQGGSFNPNPAPAGQERINWN